MKSLYESILDMDEKKSDLEALRYTIEKETGWTLSLDGKYILSGTMHFPAEIDTQFGNNGVWFESLVNCAKKYKLKIQPLGLLVLDSNSIHLLEGVDIEYICLLKIYVNNPADVNLSKIKLPVQRLSLSGSKNSYRDIDSITLPKTPVITTSIDLYTGWEEGLKNVKDMNCTNLIVNDNKWSLIDPKIGTIDSNKLQQLVDNNSNITNFFIETFVNGRKKYYQVKLKGGVVAGIMGKSEKSLITKGILEDFNQKNADYKEWYEKKTHVRYEKYNRYF